MVEKIQLQAEARRIGRHAIRELRLAGQVPAVVYGPDAPAQVVAVEGKALHRALVSAGAGLISLQIGDGQPVQVLAREVQHHPTKHHALHVDFLAVAMNERMRLRVPLVLEGIAPVLGQFGTVLVRNMDEIEIECLPQDIPNHIVADISRLRTLQDSLCVRDVVAPLGVKIVDEPAHVIVSITTSAQEPEPEAAEAPPVAEVEVVSKGKPKEAEAD
jgi:large subunit ribosomal protein L25